MPLKHLMCAVTRASDTREVVDNTRLRLLKLAVKRYGRDELAKRLRIGPEQLDDWISGERAVPNTKILAVIDLLERLGALGDEA
jgi:hypothetical protein